MMILVALEEEEKIFLSPSPLSLSPSLFSLFWCGGWGVMRCGVVEWGGLGYGGMWCVCTPKKGHVKTQPEVSYVLHSSTPSYLYFSNIILLICNRQVYT